MSGMRTLSIASAALLVAACGQSTPSTSSGAGSTSPTVEPGPAPTEEPVAISDGLIEVPGGYAYIVPRERISEYTSAGGWEVSEAQVRAVEAKLEAAVVAHATEPHHTRIRDGLAGYNRRYVGIVRGEQRLIEISGFCDSFRDWQGPVGVDDGGDCFFDAWYDPETDAITRVSINGVA